MSLKLRLDGEEIAEIEEQVLTVSVQTSRGESSKTGIGPTDGVVDIILEKVAAGGPRRLDQIEAEQLQDIRDRGVEGVPVGFVNQVATPRADQGFHDETLREGGVDKEASKTDFSAVPTRDLASGLDPLDTDARTARIEAFGKHGDADRAIKENGPTDKAFTAETGATPEDFKNDFPGPDDGPKDDDPLAPKSSKASGKDKIKL